jgi:hypothetical protein
MSDKSFPLPSDLKVVPGTEGAQAAYPYYTQFVPEDDQKFWFYNSMHFPEPMHHFDMITAEAPTWRSARSTPASTCCRPPRASSTASSMGGSTSAALR